MKLSAKAKEQIVEQLIRVSLPLVELALLPPSPSKPKSISTSISISISIWTIVVVLFFKLSCGTHRFLYSTHKNRKAGDNNVTTYSESVLVIQFDSVLDLQVYYECSLNQTNDDNYYSLFNCWLLLIVVDVTAFCSRHDTTNPPQTNHISQIYHEIYLGSTKHTEAKTKTRPQGSNGTLSLNLYTEQTQQETRIDTNNYIYLLYTYG